MKILRVIAAGVLAVSMQAAVAETRSTPEQAVALVKKGVTYLRAHGKERTIEEINAPSGKFVDRDLYLFMYDLKGTNVAIGNPVSARLLGKNLIGLKDADGVAFVQKFVDVATSSGQGWVDYRWPNPVTREIERKSSYIERVDDVLIGCGVYK